MQVHQTEAFKTLVRLGFFIEFSKVTLWHGRAKEEGESAWQVKPNFDNSKDATGNNNINGIPMLHTADNKEGALEFAKQRVFKLSNDCVGTERYDRGDGKPAYLYRNLYRKYQQSR